jgi:hypothetical protein
MEYDTDSSGVIDAEELKAWIQVQIDAGTAQYLQDEWIWDIADLVIQQQDIVNDGAKLLKIRWYPVATTIFIP